MIATRHPLFLVAATALLTTPALAEEARPWEAWQPPVIAMPEPNGFETYLKAFDLKNVIDWQFMDAQPLPAGQPPDRWGEGPRDLPLPDRLNLYAEVLKLVRVALVQDCRVPPPTSAKEWMPYQVDFCAVARLLAIEAEVHRLNGANLSAAHSALDALRVAQHAASQRTVKASLVAGDCEATAIASLDETTPGLSAADCRAVVASLLQLDRSRLPFAAILEGEEIRTRVRFKSQAPRPETMQNFQEDPATAATLRRCLYGVVAKDWAALDTYWASIRPIVALPYPRRPRKLPLADDAALQAVARGVEVAQREDLQALTELRLQEAGLAGRAHYLERKRFPRDLTALVPEYLPKVPDDPFGEGPLQGKHEPRKLTVSSVGPGESDEPERVDVDPPREPETKRNPIIRTAVP